MSHQSSTQSKIVIGTIAYGALTAPYLPLFRQSLTEQTFQNFTLLVHDNTEYNFGFSKAYNLMIKQAEQMGADYFFIINPDTYLEKTVLEKLIKILEEDEDLAVVMPKLLRWDFKNNIFTKEIDSCGLGVKSGLNFFDLGQGELDHGQHDKGTILGPGGAAALWRLTSLEKLAENGQYFDEHFFMYKEDCDLAYRLKLANLKAKLVPEAVIYHDRTSAAGGLAKRFFNRFKRSKQVNRWAFLGQHYVYIKYWRQQSFISKCLGIIHLFIMFVEALILEQYLLSCYKTIFKQMKTLKRY